MCTEGHSSRFVMRIAQYEILETATEENCPEMFLEG